MKDEIRNGVKLIRMAVSSITGFALTAENVGAEIPLHIARDDQIEPAIPIVVDETRARTPSAAAHARFGGNVGEAAVAVVVIKSVASQVGHEQINVAIVIVVTGGHAHAVQPSLQPRGFSHVGERAIAIVVIKTVPEPGVGLIGCSGTGHRGLDPCAVDEKHIEPSVVVIVEHGHATAHGFRKIFLTGSAGLVLESNSGFWGYVFEKGQRRTLRQGSREQLARRNSSQGTQ